MNQITPEMLMVFFVVLAAFVGFALACWNLIDKIKGARKPLEDMTRWQRETDAKLKNDKERMDMLEDGNRVICRGILALLSHEINGNSIDKLTASQTEITNFLIDK